MSRQPPRKRALSRRRFGRVVTLVVAGGAVWRSVSVAQTSFRVTVDLDDSRFAALAEPGGAVKARSDDGEIPVVVAHTTGGRLIAYSAVCPHRGCEVALPDDAGILRCPCHESTFDLQGRFLAGEAGSDLPPVELALSTPTAVRRTTWGRLKAGGGTEP